jgi:2-haloacid dehalogenase
VERVVIFDVLGTLFSLDAVRARLSAVGAPAATFEAWFERTLHSALTLTTVGEFRPFREVARTALQTTLTQLELDVARTQEILVGLSGRKRRKFSRRRTCSTGSSASSASDIGAYKPDRRLYEQAVNELAVAAGKATLIAAHAWDVVGARARCDLGRPAGAPLAVTDRRTSARCFSHRRGRDAAYRVVSVCRSGPR